jgi:nucleoside-diphosphate-sugar epimerase
MIYYDTVRASPTMTVLIVGAGLVGSQVARLEIEKGGERPVVLDVAPRIDALSDIFDVSRAKIIQGDILNPHEIYQIIKDEHISAIIHTAANPMLTSGAQKNPSQAIRINIMGTTNLLEASRIFSIKRFVFTSSNVLYHTKPYVEGQTRPSSIYGSTKLACECLGLNYSDFYGLEFIILGFAAVFGPWRYGGGGGPTLAIRSLLQKSLQGLIANISSEKLEFLYSKDAARACVLACHKEGLRQGIFNIGMNKIYTLAEMVKIIT